MEWKHLPAWLEIPGQGWGLEGEPFPPPPASPRDRRLACRQRWCGSTRAEERRSGCGRSHAGLCAPARARGGCEGCQPLARVPAPHRARGTAAARARALPQQELGRALGGALLLYITSPDSPRTRHCQTPRIGLISSKQNIGYEPGQLQIIPAPVKALPLCGGLGRDPASPAPRWSCSTVLGLAEIPAASCSGQSPSQHPPAQHHREQHPRAPPALPVHPGATGCSRCEVGREEPWLIPGDPCRPHPVTLPVPLLARFGSRALVLHYFKLV